MTLVFYIKTRCPMCYEMVLPVIEVDPYVAEQIRGMVGVVVRAKCSECGGILGVTETAVELASPWEWIAPIKAKGAE
jgi:hypothetical protein